MQDGDEESVADLTRLLDSEKPDPGAARAAIVPYLGDIDRYMLFLEAEPLRSPRDDYIWTIQLQEGTGLNMRATLVDCLVDVANEFKLLADTLHLVVSYVDRFLTVGAISQDQLQLLGVAALLVAAKYEEDGSVKHKVEKYSEVTASTYTKQQLECVSTMASPEEIPAYYLKDIKQ